MIKKLICKIFGHNLYYYGTRIDCESHYKCSRCGGVMFGKDYIDKGGVIHGTEIKEIWYDETEDTND